MLFSFTRSAIEKRLDRALGKGRIKHGLKGEAPNFLRITVIQGRDISVADEEHLLSRIKDSLVALSRTGDLADEFVALVDFDRRYDRHGLPRLDDMEIEAERRTASNIEAVLTEEEGRIANGLIRTIRFPENYITITTPSGDKVRSGGQVLIGRSPDCDVVIGDQIVSSHHAVISWNPENENWYLNDLDSANGTVVDGIPLQNSQARLAVDSAITIARRYTLMVTAIESAAIQARDTQASPLGQRQEVPLEEELPTESVVCPSEEPPTAKPSAESTVEATEEISAADATEECVASQAELADALPDTSDEIDESEVPTNDLGRRG